MKYRITALIISSFIWHTAIQAQTHYIAVKDALRQYAGKLQHKDFIAFPEVREHPVQWTDSLPEGWLKNDHSAASPFVLHAQPGEFFVFQTAVWAIKERLSLVQIKFSDLKNKAGEVIPAGRITCFNAGGTDFRGQPFVKEINVPAGSVQALWIGIDLPRTAKGIYKGTVIVTVGNETQVTPVQLELHGEILEDHGFDEGRRLSRLAWLNSTAGIDQHVTKGYIPISRKGNRLMILGRSMEIAANGLPAAISTYFTPSNQSISSRSMPVVDSAFRFVIEQENGDHIALKPGNIRFTSASPSAITWQVINSSDECDLVCNGRLEFDGFAAWNLTLKAKRSLQIKDIRLETPVNKEKAVYMMGLNKAGGFRPAEWNWTWDTTKNQDALWIGDVNGGLRIKWKAENYVLPLVNIYYKFGPLHLPPSWGNAGKGGVRLFEKGREVMVQAYSGSRSMAAGDVLHYDFELLITPFRTLNKEVQFGDRYYHSDKDVSSGFVATADSLGANIINIHHKKDIYPYINYPFADISVAGLKDFIDRAHQDNKRVKVYYTTRELTVNLPEFRSFLSLNGEVIYPGPGAGAKTLLHPDGPDPWLLQNLRGKKYIPAWVASFTSGKYAGLRDLSVITTPDSRLNNFYIGGLDWMTRHLHIDGVYIDDCALDRFTIRRERKILDDNRPAARIDLHSWNHFNEYAGWASCLNMYMDLLPYIDQVWIGEGRNYDTPPDYWLVEISGIPFGLPGQMLQDGGNPWRGMVYGITNRAGWVKNPPDHLWQFWDRYGIKDKTMIGYWDSGTPVSTDNDSIKVTLYKGATKSMLAVGNFSSADQQCSVHVDFKKLGYDRSKTTYFIPAIERYQDGQQLESLDHLKVPAKKGYLIVLKQDH